MQEENETKRKRLSLACNVCRRKKIKCDGVKPVCGKCSKQNQECSYTSTIKKRGPRQGHIELLEQRLKKMEELMTSGASNNNGGIQQDPLSIAPLVQLEYNVTPEQQLPKIFPQPTSFSADALPSTDVIQHLVDTFFQNCVTAVPIIDVEGFKFSIRNNTCSMFLLYSVMAVAARFSKRADIVESPLWMSGEKYAVKARAMIDQVIESPSMENVQGLIILVMNEYGCGRGPRCWMYTGIATRMSIEIGLYKEKIFEEGHNSVLPLERWFWYETRRKIFWASFMHDKFASASTGRPAVLDPNDCDIMLPVDFNVLESISGDDFYQASLDQTKLVHYHIVRDESTNIITGIQMNPLDVNRPEHRLYLNRIGWDARIVQEAVLLGKVIQFVNRGSKNAGAYTAYEKNSEFEKLDRELDKWVEGLPLQIRNTPANLERYRNLDSVRSAQYVLGHILHNSLVVILNRPSLVVADMPGLSQVTQEIQDKVHKSMEKCLAAADNVTVILKDLCCQIEVVLPFISYSVYIAATVIVNNIFAMNGQENQKAESALKEYFRFLSGLKVYWAMADKLYFMICDLYAIHQKVLDTCQRSQSATASSSSISTSWNTNNNDNTFISPYPTNSTIPKTKRPLEDISSSTNDFTNNQNWNSQENGFFSFQNNNEQGRTRSFFTDPSNTSLSVPSFDLWLRQQHQNRSSS